MNKYYAITNEENEILGTGNSVYQAWDNAAELGNISCSKREDRLKAIEITKAVFFAQSSNQPLHK